MKLYLTIFSLLGLILGNYLYQYFNASDYAIAFEHSYFQVFAIGTVWFEPEPFIGELPTFIKDKV